MAKSETKSKRIIGGMSNYNADESNDTMIESHLIPNNFPQQELITPRKNPTFKNSVFGGSSF
jgi:hypothetical protein